MAGVKKKNPLLTNYLRHTNVHNRVQEEREMWRLRKLEMNHNQQDSMKQSSRVRTSITTGRLLSDSYHEEEFEKGGCRNPMAELPSKSYYWTRQLMKTEEADTNRWGHSGYKEHHPEEFVTTEEDNSDETDKRVQRKQSKSEKKKKKLKRRKRHSSSSSSSSSSDEVIVVSSSRKKRLDKQKKKKKKSKGI